MNSFINLFNSSVEECWDCKGLSQFRVKELKYSELAREIAVLQDMWQEAGLERKASNSSFRAIYSTATQSMNLTRVRRCKD